MAAAAGATLTGTAFAEPELAAPISDGEITPLDLFITNTPLGDLNAARQAMIDAATEDWVCEDGTVIPAIWVKVQMLCDGLGRGVGGFEGVSDASLAWYMRLCDNNEEYAQILLDMPMGIDFTITDATAACDKDPELIRAALDALSYTGFVFHSVRAGVDHWHTQRYAHGILEASQNLYDEPGFIPVMFAGLGHLGYVPQGMFHAIPVNSDVCVDNKVLPFDDYEEMLARNTKFAVSPCQCHYFNKYLGGALYEGDDSDVPLMGDWDAIHDYVCSDGTHLEKCIVFGEEAEYYIEIGIAKELTREEAREHLQRSVDEGCVLNSVSTRYSEVICCCSGPCLILGGMRACEPGSMSHVMWSNNLLEYDSEICLKCGLCAQRCPLQAITMSEETGLPEITGACMRCGQCAYVCPAQARKIVAKPEDEVMYMSADLLEACNDECAYRMETGAYPALPA